MAVVAPVMSITTPVGNDLRFRSATLREEVSRMPDFTVEVLSEKSDIASSKLLGQRVTITLELPGNEQRHFDMFVVKFSGVGTEGGYYKYVIKGRPWTWFLTRTSDCRIFQGKTVPEIVKEIFGKYGVAAFKDKLSGSYRTWDYCVQYRESDWNFVSRLLECEGIYTYFQSEAGKQTLILCDGPNAHEAYPGYATIPYIAHDQAARLDQEYFTDWSFSDSVQSGNFVQTDYDFEKPHTSLLTQSGSPRKHEEAAHEIFDYPGAYKQFGDGDQYARTRLDEMQCQFGRAEGSGNARGLATGYLFTLSGYPWKDQNKQYLVVATDIIFSDNGPDASGGGGASYHVACQVINIKEHFRPARLTTKPHVQGPQTAVVVGPAGDEIYTDNYGRVKVQFHWDRYGKRDENASCWVRVASPWAGKNFGMVAIPRIGQEVVVDFLEGDPDQPLITGRVYNAAQMPPYGLPANKTQTGILTRSSMDGTAANANEIRFEDLKGSEHLLIHAEKDQMIEVEHDETHWVGHDRSKTIDHDETSHIKHDRTETVDNNESITIGVNRTEKVGKNEDITIGANRTEHVADNETIAIGQNRSETVGQNESVQIGQNQTVHVGGNRSVTIDGSKSETVTLTKAETIILAKALSVGLGYQVSVGGAMNTTVGLSMTEEVMGSKTVRVGKKLTLIAGDELEIQVGKATFVMKSDGTITKNGSDISVNATGNVVIAANDTIDLN